MSSIFTDFYLGNMQRLNSRADANSPSKEPVQKGQNTFAEVLSDLEKSSKDGELAKSGVDSKSVDGAKIPTLTNLRAGEYQTLNTSGQAMHLHGDLPEGMDVKKTEIPVKTQPPKPELPGSPAAPTVVSAKRLGSEKTAGETNISSAKTGKVPDYHLGEIKDIIVTAGKYHGVDPHLSLAVAQAESSFQTDAVSKDGHASKGIFQLLDSTAQDMMGITGVEEHYEPFDPGMNAFLGVGYLRRLHNIFSNSTQLTASIKTHPAKSADELEKLAVAAFNTGEGNVARAQARALALGKDPSEFSSIEPHLPSITREYVRKVSKFKDGFGGAADEDELA